MVTKSSRKILLISGEASGDQFAGDLLHSLQRKRPDDQYFGVGGKMMEKAGCQLLATIDHLSVMGVFDVLTRLPHLLNLQKKLTHWLDDEQPDLVILIDYPGFNLRFAKAVHQRNIPLLYYIAPKTWASRAKRIQKMQQWITQLAVIFPFEVDYFKAFSLPVQFVGNPTLTRLRPYLKQSVTPQSCVALLPGSRPNEIKRHLPVLLKAARFIQQQYPKLQWILPRASSISDKTLAPYLKGVALNLTIIAEDTIRAIQSCKAAIVASGTATLEVALLGVPQVIVYRTHPLTYQIAKWLIKLKYIGLCNIIAKEEIAIELVQQHATASRIAKEVLRIIERPYYCQKRKEQTQLVIDALNQPVDQPLPDLVVALLEKPDHDG